MANDKTKVVVGKPLATGGALIAPLGTALPTDATTALNAAYVATGYVTDDGVTKGEKRDSDVINAWGGDTIAAVQKSYGVTFKLSLAEFLGAGPQTAIYGGTNVVSAAATSSKGNTLKVTATSAPCPHNMWAFEILDDIKKVRIVIPDGQITDIGDQTFKDDDIAANEVTITCFPDASGAYFYTFTDDGQKTSS
jgi:hypothetical protein